MSTKKKQLRTAVRRVGGAQKHYRFRGIGARGKAAKRRLRRMKRADFEDAARLPRPNRERKS